MLAHTFELSQLTSMEPGPRRDKLTLALADTLADRRVSRVETSEVLGDLLMNLVVAASRDLRMRVAAKLAEVEWAPRELALSLALDEYEVAEPVVARCRALAEDDLLTIAQRGTTQHRRTLAGRPDVSGRVCDAITAAGEPEVLVALLQNFGARLTHSAFKTCIDVAQSEPGLHRPLASREDLPPQFVEAVYLVVSDSLRSQIAQRYTLDEESLRRVIGAAVKQASALEAEHQHTLDAENAALVRALQQSGSLTGEFVIRAVRDGHSEILEHSVARLADIDLADVRRTIDKHGPWAVALCCRVCDIPRRDFAALIASLVKSGRMAPVVSSSVESAAAQTFVAHSPTSAADALRRIA